MRDDSDPHRGSQSCMLDPSIQGVLYVMKRSNRGTLPVLIRAAGKRLVSAFGIDKDMITGQRAILTL